MDEHYELSKALLWSKGFYLYRQVWDDQPPLHTVLLGLGFKAFGANIALARALAVAFGLSLLGACGLLVNKRHGPLAGFLAATALLVAPEVFELSLSFMQEAPAIGMALWALWPLLRWQERVTSEIAARFNENDQRGIFQTRSEPSKQAVPVWSWLVLSGAIMAAALQIKLTALIVVPALVAEILLGLPRLSRAGWGKEAARAVGIWAGGLASVYAPSAGDKTAAARFGGGPAPSLG